MNFSTRLGAWDETIVWLNAAFAFVACAANVRAAARCSTVWTRAMHATIAALAAGYVASYVALELGDLDPAAWSSLMRGVSLVAWLSVWTVPALKRTREEALVERFAATLRDELAERRKRVA